MKQLLIKIGVLAGVFIAALVFTSYLTNHENEDLTSEMEEATLPVVYMMKNNAKMNDLHGYTTEMDGRYVRDNILPLNKDLKINLQVQTYGFQIDAMSYEVRSLDMERLIENKEVADYKNSGERAEAELTLENLLEENKEYLLTLSIVGEGKTVRYYTRVMLEGDSHMDECLEFVKNFHETTLNPETLGTLSTFLEPTATADNSTLNKVTIHSNLTQIGWGSFKGDVLSAPVTSVKEITDYYNVIILDYIMTSKGNNGELEYYNVEEYYRVRYTTERIYLLDFERTMNQIFRGENDNFYKNYIQLGIRDGDVQYMANGNGTCVLFVQDGELWAYNQSMNQEAQVFSFRGFEGIDARENYDQHDIELIQVDENGSADFIVYGYMNRGRHEGQVGVSVYHYDSAVNTIEEEVFISSDQSYQVMKEDLGQLLYTSKSGYFYFMVDGTVYQVNLQNMNVDTVAKGLKEGNYAVSESGRHVAWIGTDGTDAGRSMQMLDLETAKQSQQDAESGKKLKPLCYMREDLVYGIANESEIAADKAGNTVFPMHQANILNEAGQVEKEYRKAGYYIMDAYVEADTIYLNLASPNGGVYVVNEQDTIVNNKTNSEKMITLHTTVTEERQTQIQIKLPEEVPEKSPKLLTPKNVLFDGEREVDLNREKKSDVYYAYAKGRVVAASESLPEVVRAANEEKGIVVDSNQEYVWKRARANAVQAFKTTLTNTEGNSSETARCMALLLETEGVHISVDALLNDNKTPAEILQSALPNEEIIDLAGCSLDEVLYYVSEKKPVIAMDSAEGPVVITGYDTVNITVYQPGSNSVKTEKISDWAESFAAAGNMFITCR